MLSDSWGLLHPILLIGQSISGPNISHRQDVAINSSGAAASSMQSTSCSLLSHTMLYTVPSLDDKYLPADSNLTGTIPASLGTALPDLQLLSLRHNPGAQYMQWHTHSGLDFSIDTHFDLANILDSSHGIQNTSDA